MTGEEANQKKTTAKELDRAIKLVNEAIHAEEERLKKIASAEEQSPIMLEGYTNTNHFCKLMVDPKDVARIMLEYNYPTWKVLEEETPEAMWEDLGRLYGLSAACSADI